jgi:outer membrane protein
LNFSLGLGYGSRSNPIVNGRDIPLILVPQLSYYGKRFFIENLDVGYTLYENASNAFSLVATPGYDRVFFYRNDPQNYFIGGGTVGPSASSAPPYGATGVPPGSGTAETEAEDPQQILERERDTTYLAGPEWNFNYGRVSGQVSALYEVTGRYNGSEVRAAIAVPLIQTSGALTASAGATWKSAELVTYYYGEKGIYEAGSALNPFVKLAYKLPLGDHWRINALAHYEWLDDAIANSPIIVEQSVTTIFAGVEYSF